MKLINHMAFLFQVTDGTLQLTNQQDAEVFCSWKVGGQDFYAYGKAIKADCSAVQCVDCISQDQRRSVRGVK